jgi:hypothetical protein
VQVAQALAGDTVRKITRAYLEVDQLLRMVSLIIGLMAEMLSQAGQADVVPAVPARTA